MATDVERLVVALEARTAAFDRALQKAVGTANTRAGQIEKRFAAVNTNLERIMGAGGAVLSRSLGVIGGALGARELVQAADAYTRIGNNLRTAGLSGSDAAAVFEQLFQIAQRSAVPLEGLAELYNGLSQAQKGLGATSSEIVGLTSIVANALQVSGQSAAGASGALLQLRQVLSGTRVEWEDYSSLIDGLQPLLQAAAAGLKEAGGSVSTLSALVKDGKVSSQAFFRAIEAGAPILEGKLAGSVQTTAQAFTTLQNALIVSVGKINEATGATSALNAVIVGTGNAAITASDGILTFAKSYEALAKARIAAANAEVAAAAKTSPFLQKLLDATQPGSGYTTGGTMDDYVPGTNPGPSRAQLYNRPITRPVVPISLNDFKVPTSGSSGGSRGGGSGAAKGPNEYEREVQSINEKIRALEAEAGAIGKTRLEQEKAKTLTELENAANRAKVTVTDDVRAKMVALSEAQAQAVVKAEELKKAQDDLVSAADSVRSTLGSTTGGFLNDIAEGTSRVDALRNAFTSLRTAILNALGNRLIESLLGSSGTVSPIFASLGFGGPRAGGGSVQPGKEYYVGERGPERFVPTSPGAIVPARREQSGIVIQGDTINIQNGNTAEMERVLQEREARIMRQIPDAVRKAQVRGR
jgi:tape measure domain-containing protein